MFQVFHVLLVEPGFGCNIKSADSYCTKTVTGPVCLTAYGY